MILRPWVAIAGLLAVEAQPPPASLGFDQTSPNASQIDDYLRGKHSALSGEGQVFFDAGKHYDVDPRLLIAVAGAETGFGKHLCAANNVWNWFHRGSCPPSTFESHREGLEHVAKYLRKSYINRGFDTIPKIRMKYCATGCDNWTSLVTAFRQEMPASANPPASLPANPATPAPARQGGRSPEIFGLPLAVPFLAAAVLVFIWLLRLVRRR